MLHPLLPCLAALATSLPAAADILTFDDLGLPHGTVITNQYAGRGVLFAPQDGEIQLRAATNPIFPLEPMGLTEIPYGSSVIIANFPLGALSAGAWIDFGQNSSPVTIEAFDGPGATGTIIASAQTTIESLLQVQAPGIRSVRIRALPPGPVTFLIDNFTFQLIPAPAAAAILPAGLLLASRRRR
jgi:hypothetical protein